MMSVRPTRRSVLRHLALGGLAAAALPLWAEELATLALNRRGGNHGVLSEREKLSVIALSERIIPGATKARVAEFIDAMLADARPETRARFLDGLRNVDRDIDDERLSDLEKNGDPFFLTIKSLTITGYYTSEAAMREELGAS